MRMHQTRLVLRLALLLTASLVLAGCGGGKNFSDEDFKKVEKGTSEDKAKEILGAPFDSMEVKGIKRMWWKVGDKYYSASFKDGKVESAEGPSKKEEYEMMKALMGALKDK